MLERVGGLEAEHLLGALEEAIGARLVTEVPQAVDRYSFSHALIRDTLYEELSTPRRVLLHRHLGFATHVAVNDRVMGLLARIPGLQLVPGPAHPGHMCSALAAVRLAASTRGAGSPDVLRATAA